jgi:RNA methyltransferase, TrmH family
MPVRRVTSKHNARLKELRGALNQPGRGSLAAIEGPTLLEEALRAGLRVACVFAAEGAERMLEGISLPSETEILILPEELLASALTTETPQPVAALVEPPAWTWEDLRAKGGNPLLVVLAGLQDAGNLGTILRSAEAFGANGVLSLPGTVNAWNPKAVRASAGSVFRLPLLHAPAAECFPRLRKAGVRLWTTAARAGTSACEVDLAAAAALLIGNEGNGVPAELAAQADGAVTIPCPGPVESLNAAVAASVLLYEAARQRSAASGGQAVKRRAR